MQRLYLNLNLNLSQGLYRCNNVVMATLIQTLYPPNNRRVPSLNYGWQTLRWNNGDNICSLLRRWNNVDTTFVVCWVYIAFFSVIFATSLYRRPPNFEKKSQFFFHFFLYVFFQFFSDSLSHLLHI